MAYDCLGSKSCTTKSLFYVRLVLLELDVLAQRPNANGRQLYGGLSG
jgi:hypothetical protein